MSDSEYTRAELIEAYFAALAAAAEWNRKAEELARPATIKASEARRAVAQLYELMSACDPEQHEAIRRVGGGVRTYFDWAGVGAGPYGGPNAEWRRWMKPKSEDESQRPILGVSAEGRVVVAAARDPREFGPEDW